MDSACLLLRWKMAAVFVVSMQKDRALCHVRKLTNWLSLPKVMVQKALHTLQSLKMAQENLLLLNS